MTSTVSGGHRAFPVVVVPYDPAWQRMFDEERALLDSSLADLGTEIEHIGSTSVPALAAKPKIDILVGLRAWEDLGRAVERLSRLGYLNEPQLDVPRHLSMKRGHPTTHRIHLVEGQGSLWHEYLAFRDALRAEADLRARYAELKQRLALQHRDDHQAYSAGKSPFIEAVIEHQRQTGRRRSPNPSVVQRAFDESDAVRELRQLPTFRALVEFVEQTELYRGALLIGSFAAGAADEMSDLDLILITRDGKFGDAWERRGELHVTGALAAWDEPPEGPVGAHKWVTRDLIFVECLVAAPGSGVRLAQPFVVVAGGDDLPHWLEQRSPILRTEMRQASHPIERAYDELKVAIRAFRATTPDG
jgi:GrpB-like predicted nucleotidyltransferase (UPF0157 family)